MPVGRPFIQEVAELDEVYWNPILHLRSRQGASVPGQFLHNSCTTLHRGCKGFLCRNRGLQVLSLHVRWGLLLVSFFFFFFLQTGSICGWILWTLFTKAETRWVRFYPFPCHDRALMPPDERLQCIFSGDPNALQKRDTRAQPAEI